MLLPIVNSLIILLTAVHSQTITDNVPLPISGDLLVLTKYIEKGKSEMCKKLSRVTLTEELNITSYSGFFTVNREQNSNLFFWFFPAMNNDTTAPLILWIQGGPGSSSLASLFLEISPIMVVKGNLMKRQYTWAAEHNLLFLDSPVGVGFSFTESGGYMKDAQTIGEQLYEAVQQFYEVFSELQNNSLYASGEYDACKFLPYLGFFIDKGNTVNKKKKIRLRGLTLSNGFCDPYNQLVIGKYLYELGIIGMNGLGQLESLEKNARNNIMKGNLLEAHRIYKYLHGLAYTTLTGMTSYDNFLSEKFISVDYCMFVEKEKVVKSIHVGNMTHNTNIVRVKNNLKEAIMKSAIEDIEYILARYKVLFYNGQLNALNSYPSVVNLMRRIKFKDSKKYAKGERKVWRVDNEVAGYVRTAGNLTEVLIRNAGFMVAYDQPKWTLDLITKFVNDKPIS